MQSSPDHIASVLGRIPSGISILIASGPGTGDDKKETGMLASWVQQASFDPPMVTVAVNQKRYLNEWLSDGTPVVINLVGESQKNFLKHFGSGFEPDEPAFDGLDVQPAGNGVTSLTDALGWLEGTIKGKMMTGDHIIYAVELTAAHQGAQLDTEKPYVHIRKNGLNY